MRSPNVNTGKLMPVCSAAALVALWTTSAASGADDLSRFPGSEMGLNGAIVRSDLIETAEIVSMGSGHGSAAMYFFDIHVKTSVLYKGARAEGGQGSTSLSLTIRDGEATPRTGEEYVLFIKQRQIIKVLPKTGENVRALSTMVKHRDGFINGTKGELHGSTISIDDAVSRSDIVETAIFSSGLFWQSMGGMKFMPQVGLKPTAVFKGYVDGREQICGIGVCYDEAIPKDGVEYITFIDTKNRRGIIKLLPKTDENVRAVKAVTAVP